MYSFNILNLNIFLCVLKKKLYCCKQPNICASLVKLYIKSSRITKIITCTQALPSVIVNGKGASDNAANIYAFVILVRKSFYFFLSSSNNFWNKKTFFLHFFVFAISVTFALTYLFDFSTVLFGILIFVFFFFFVNLGDHFRKKL